MNAERRKQIARALALVAEAQSIIESARDDEQEYLDVMPEAIQNGDKGTKAQENIDTLEEIGNALGDIDCSAAF